MKGLNSKKKLKQMKWVRESLEGKFFGYCHRSHRTRKTQKKDATNLKHKKLQKIKDKEAQKEINKYI